MSSTATIVSDVPLVSFQAAGALTFASDQESVQRGSFGASGAAGIACSTAGRVARLRVAPGRGVTIRPFGLFRLTATWCRAIQRIGAFRNVPAT